MNLRPLFQIELRYHVETLSKSEKAGFQLLLVHQSHPGQLSPLRIRARQNYRNRAIWGGELWTE